MLLMRPAPLLDMATANSAFDGYGVHQHHLASSSAAAATTTANTAAAAAAAAAAASASVAVGDPLASSKASSIRRSSTIPVAAALHQQQQQQPHHHHSRNHLLHTSPFIAGSAVDECPPSHTSHPSKRRRTDSYLAPQEPGVAVQQQQQQKQQQQQPQPQQQAYGHFAPLPQNARPSSFVPYSQPIVDQPYFHINGELSHATTSQQQPPSLYHSESSIDSVTSMTSMATTFPSYIPEPTPIMHHHPGAGGSSDPAGPPEPWDPMLFDTGLQLKVQSLPVLDNCATKILEALSSPDWHDVLEAATQPDSGRGQAYSTQVALFDQIKTYYTRDQLFLNTQTLNLDPSADDIVRRTNLATFAATIFGQHNLPFSELHASCLDIFLPNGAPLTKPVANLMLELKTQAYLAAIHGGAPDQQDLIEYFPSDLQAQLTRRRLGTQQFSPIEVDFVNKVNLRREQLIDQQYAPYSASLFPMWSWQDFLQILCECLRQTMQPTINVSTTGADYGQMLFVNGVHNTSLSGAQQPQPTQADGMAFPSYRDQDAASLSRVRSLSQTSGGLKRSLTDMEDRAPIQQQYEKARASTTSNSHSSHSKATPPARRISAASQRKPWSQEEEKALMDGLDQVKGPHWSQILALYGAGGRVSEVLRERTQVQLKDKARNLKLFFLKSGIDVPAPLQGVTGELKTRAPAQAAKREREERLRAEREAAEKKGAAAAAAQAVGLGDDVGIPSLSQTQPPSLLTVSPVKVSSS